MIFETDYQRLFESKANQANDALRDSVDAKIILTSTPYILCEQFKLDNNNRTGIQPTPYQQSYEMVRRSQSRTVNFEASARQFSFLEFSLVYDSSEQHKSIYDSYNAEVAAVQISSIKLENASDTYSEFNTIKFDLTDEHDRYILYSAFTAWICKGSSIAPLTDYAHNIIYQKRLRQEKYLTDSGEKVYIDLRRGKGHTSEFERVNHDNSDLTITVELKVPTTKKMRLHVTGYYQGEYMYMLGKDGLIMNYKEYTVQKKQKQKQKQKKKILKMIKTLYVNKRGRLILGEGQNKIIKKQKDGGLGALLIPLTKAALSAFGSGKKRRDGKKKQNNYGKTRCCKKSYSTKQ